MKIFFSRLLEEAKQTLKKSAFVFGSVLGVYILLFFLFYPSVGPRLTMFASFPVIAGAWLWGMRVGLLLGVLSFLLNTLLLNLAGEEHRLDAFWMRQGGLLGTFLIIIMGVVVGRLHDVQKRLKEELSKNIRNLARRKKAEQLLKNYSQVLEERVKERTKELEKANLALSEFIDDAAHELRTPLAIAKSNLDLALRHRSKSDVNPYEVLSVVNEEIKRVSLILSDLILLSGRKGQDEQQLRWEKIALDELLERIVFKSQALGQEKNISISLNKKGKLNVRANRDALERLVLNLISNALKYGKMNGWIRVILEQEDSYAKLTVADNGIGIPENELPHIFERFYRVNKARSRKDGGIGLGLAICKWIVETHRGKIEASSVHKKGSIFTVYLPVSKD